MFFEIVFAHIQYRASRIACRLFGWSPAFRHLGIGCRGREDCAAKIRKTWETNS